MAKARTLEQVEETKRKAVRFVRDVLGDEARADEIEAEDPLDYAERKRIRILDNPAVLETITITRRRAMATVEPTKGDLEGTLDDVQDVLEDAYSPEATREELAEAIGKALDMLESEDEGPEEEDEEAELGED